jgi:hypothetical protein
MGGMEELIGFVATNAIAPVGLRQDHAVERIELRAESSISRTGASISR